jgi:hypothetical protein
MSDRESIGKYPDTVGDIAFDEKLDEADFKNAEQEKTDLSVFNIIMVQRHLGIKEKKLRSPKSLKRKYIFRKKNNGYITVRFLVNCEGKTGLFRLSI